MENKQKIDFIDSFIFNDGGRKAAGFKGKANDCVCRAISITTGLPYQEVYKRLADGNASLAIAATNN